MVAILVLFTFISFITIDYFVQRAHARKAARAAVADRKVWNIPLSTVPKGIFLDRSHQWLQLESDGALRIGVDPMIGAVLGAFSVRLPSSGTKVKKGDPIVSLKSGPRVMNLKAPFDGEVAEINASLSSDAMPAKQSPFGNGWFYRLRPTEFNPHALASRPIGEEAITWMKNEMQRLRDYVATLTSVPSLVGATLQDGGEPCEGFATELDDAQFKKLEKEFFAS
jgi:glycine cleavage system H protein